MKYASVSSALHQEARRQIIILHENRVIVSSDRSSYSDDGLLYIQQKPLFEIFTQSIDAIDVTSVTLSRLNSINAIHVTRCKLMLIEAN